MKKKKVLLVYTNTEKAPYPVPPIGLCLVAQAIKAKYDVMVFDGLMRPRENIFAVIRDFNPHYVGFGVRNIDNIVMDNPTYFIDDIFDTFIAPVRAHSNAVCIVGGSGFSVFPQEILERFGIEYGIAGEGETSFSALLDALDKGESVDGIPGVVVKGAPRTLSPDFQYSTAIQTLDESEIDKWIDFSPYRQRGAYPIQTKRGCSQQCIYCTYPCIEGTTYRRRDPKAIANEIENVHHRLGDVLFEFVDSTFNDPPGHAEEICREIIKKNMKVRLRTMGINPHRASKELFDLMISAGFTQIDCTPDSGSGVMLANLRKNFTKKELETTAGIIRQCNIPTMWFFIFGGPGETEETIGETFSFIDEFVSPQDMVYMMAGLRVYPKTALYDIALSEGSFQKDGSILKPVFYVTKSMPRQRIHALLFEAAQKRHNCVLAADSTPPPQLLQKAMELRNKQNLQEPMFRTLLRIRLINRARSL